MVSLLVMMVLIIGIVVPRFRRVQKLVDKINSVARENLTGINVVHAYNAEDYQNEKFEKGNVTLMKTQLFNQRAFALLMPSRHLGDECLVPGDLLGGGGAGEQCPLRRRRPAPDHL